MSEIVGRNLFGEYGNEMVAAYFIALPIEFATRIKCYRKGSLRMRGDIVGFGDRRGRRGGCGRRAIRKCRHRYAATHPRIGLVGSCGSLVFGAAIRTQLPS